MKKPPWRRLGEGTRVWCKLAFEGGVNGSHALDDMLVDGVAAHAVCHAAGVEDGGAAGGAVGDDGDAAHAHEGAAANGVGAHAHAEFFEDGFEEEAAHFGHKAAHDAGFKPVAEGFGGGFHALEEDVAGEAVCYGDVEVGLEEVMPLAVADEVEGEQSFICQVFEEPVGLQRESAAFAVFRTVAHDAYVGGGAVVDVFGHEGTHDGVTDEVAGLGVRVGAGVAHQYIAVLAGQGGDDAGAFHAVQKTQFDGAGGHGSPGVTGREHGIAGAVFYHVYRYAHGGFFLLAYGNKPAFVHAHYFVCMYDFQARVGTESGGVAGGFERVFVSDKVKLFECINVLQCQFGTVYVLRGGVVSPHGIES